MSHHDHSFDTEGLVLPRKLPNPVAESREKKDLHREMLWKMKFGSNDPKNCELAKAYAGYANRQRMKALEEEQAKQMTFEKLLEEQRHRLHSVGHSQHNNQQQNSADSDVTFDLASSSSVNSSSSTTSTAGAPLLKANGEFYEVFSKVRAKTASSSSSSSNGEPSSSQAASFDLAPKAFAKAV